MGCGPRAALGQDNKYPQTCQFHKQELYSRGGKRKQGVTEHLLSLSDPSVFCSELILSLDVWALPCLCLPAPPARLGSGAAAPHHPQPPGGEGGSAQRETEARRVLPSFHLGVFVGHPQPQTAALTRPYQAPTSERHSHPPLPSHTSRAWAPQGAAQQTIMLTVSLKLGQLISKATTKEDDAEPLPQALVLTGLSSPVHTGLWGRQGLWLQ